MAKDNWQRSAYLNTLYPTVWRNLALYHANKTDNNQLALEYIEKAFQLNTSDARILMELDQLRKHLQHHPEERLA